MLELIWALSAVGALAGIAATAGFMFKCVKLRKPGEPIFPSAMQSPFNIVFQPERLTEEGLRARRHFFISAAIAIGCSLLGAAVSFIHV